MPLVTISVLSGRMPSEKQSISNAIHDALIEAFCIPPDDYNHRILEYDPENFLRPPGKSANYVLVEMTVFPGRSPAAKARLYKGIVDRLEALGVPRSDVLIVLNEPPMGNWGVRGGLPADSVDIGFKLTI